MRAAPIVAKEVWHDVTDEMWNDWIWQMNHRFSTVGFGYDQEKQRMILLRLANRLNEPGIGDYKALFYLDTAMTPHLIALVRQLKEAGRHEWALALLRTLIPSHAEVSFRRPISFKVEGTGTGYAREERYPSCPKALRRLYDDRVVITPTFSCPVLCRHCFRRNDSMRKEGVSGRDLSDAFNYIQDWNSRYSQRPIREIVFSGGDPLTLRDDMLADIFSRARSINGVEAIRVDTKFLTALPQRITPDLVGVLQKYVNLICIHAIHPGEITPEMADACQMLAEAGIILRSYTPLLRAVNDERRILKELFWQLYIKCKVSPYYLVHFIETLHAQHFKVPLERGIEIMGRLQVELSGVCVPKYICYLPQGGGKVELNQGAILDRTDEGYWFRSPITGEPALYSDPR